MQLQSPNLHDCYQLYRLDAKARRVTSETLRTYKDRIEPFIAWCQAQKVDTLTAVTASHVRAYLVHLQERNLSSYTVNGVARALKVFFNFCLERKIARR